MKPKLLTFYFPQFHSIPENDEWWGEGFTDWDLVKKSKPLFANHHQPRIPLNGYYNPCEYETLKNQASLANKYGISGFVFYHYWFDGKLYLEKPLENYLRNKDINLPFCLTWANETWTRSWVGKPEIFLQKQTHKPDKALWEKHFDYLYNYFLDKRYITKEGKPILLIYQPSLLVESSKMLKYWNDLSLKKGLNGIYFIGIKNHSHNKYSDYSMFDAILKFQPREAYNSKGYTDNNATKIQWLRSLPEYIQSLLRKINYKYNSYKTVNSERIWEIILENAYKCNFINDKEIFESFFFDWDNTPRYGNKATIYRIPSENTLINNLTKLYNSAQANASEFIFFNAWNEWSEGAYLEPDSNNGFKYLEILNKVFKGVNQQYI